MPPLSTQLGCVLGLLKSAVELDGVHVHPGQRRIGAELADQSGGVERRAAGQLVAVEEDDVGLAELGQVVGDARAADAASDDDDTRSIGECACLAARRRGAGVSHASQRMEPGEIGLDLWRLVLSYCRDRRA